MASFRYFFKTILQKSVQRFLASFSQIFLQICWKFLHGFIQKTLQKIFHDALLGTPARVSQGIFAGILPKFLRNLPWILLMLMLFRNSFHLKFVQGFFRKYHQRLFPSVILEISAVSYSKIVPKIHLGSAPAFPSQIPQEVL